jgi:aspartate/methionine/tyrosine aminotransferase
MDNYSKQSVERLREIQADLERQYAGYQARSLKLDMSRGKPSGSQLDLTNGILDRLDGYMVEGGIDARNYGCLEGIHEARKLFSELLGIPQDRLMIGGNSSLNMMYDTIVRHWVFGTHGQTPWGRLPVVKFLCPCPGYDRHFAICEDLGIEMIPVPMTPTGPHMDMVEQLAGSDASIKGIWCVPLYSNPQGVCYSDETVDRLASMHTAAPDFRIFWDNAYGVHHIYEECRLKDIFASAEAAGNPERVYYFFSTSKITFPGAGVALLATGPGNFAELKHHMSIQTIGPDKLNQLRTVRYLKSAEGVREHMRVLARELRPKFDLVLDTLDRELGKTGLASWMRPKGGYFISLDTIPGCAKDVIELAKNAGVKMTGPGAAFPLHHDPLDRNIRIAPSYPPLDELKTAIELFCICVKLAGIRRLLMGKIA